MVIVQICNSATDKKYGSPRFKDSLLADGGRDLLISVPLVALRSSPAGTNASFSFTTTPHTISKRSFSLENPCLPLYPR